VFAKWALRPIFCDRSKGDAGTHDKEKQLTREDRTEVERAIPGTEVLAVELTSPERFRYSWTNVQGVYHALCERVTNVLRDYLREYSVDVSSPGLERRSGSPTIFAPPWVAARTTHRERSRVRGEVVAADERAVTCEDASRVRGHPV